MYSQSLCLCQKAGWRDSCFRRCLGPWSSEQARKRERGSVGKSNDIFCRSRLRTIIFEGFFSHLTHAYPLVSLYLPYFLPDFFVVKHFLEIGSAFKLETRYRLTSSQSYKQCGHGCVVRAKVSETDVDDQDIIQTQLLPITLRLKQVEIVQLSSAFLKITHSGRPLCSNF